ncbi:hypothetical protein [Psychrobium sp. 1_MG-2023]|uniref:hypothetical protein n=1 Tax=Psychrobium sp. 1_MG-2023 TaxID=3062624 RepID=UPI000C339A8D|nr:hypothetical protein [Psychrobium sp. 1_MG-2023]MDP2561196.1 hypothetical protein [Psychrobium sp. 1_MG-2023]PKF55298.1 hypothetical protein CW748_13865 [Alteromonadales bacterium alter-6D02]
MKKLLLALLVSVGASSHVNALDYKIFNGSMCKAISGSDSVHLNRAYSQLTNISSTKSVDVICPIVKDVDSQDSVDYARIVVRTPNGNTTCTTVAAKQVGTNYPSNPTVIGQNSSIQERVLFNVDATTPVSAYSIKCALAPKAEILNYKFGE